MTVRRRYHAYSTTDSTGLETILHLSPDNIGRQWNAQPRTRGAVHPAMTTFGPQTLAEFVRSQTTQSTEAPESKGKGKSKSKASDENVTDPAYNDPPNFSPDAETMPTDLNNLHELLARDAQARESLRPARVLSVRNDYGRSSQQDTVDPTDQSSKDSPQKRRSERRAKIRATIADADNDPFASSTSSPPARSLFSLGPPMPPPGFSRTETFQLPRSPRRRRCSAAGSRRGWSWNSDTTSPTDGTTPPRSIASILHASTSPRRFRRASRNISLLDLDCLSNTNHHEAQEEELASVSSVAVSAPNTIVPFDYALVVPTVTPNIVAQEPQSPSAVHAKRKRVQSSSGFFGGYFGASAAPDDDDDSSDDDDDDDRESGSSDGFSDPRLWSNSSSAKRLSISNDISARDWCGTGPSPPPGSPPECPLPPRINYQMPSLPSDIWIAVTSYLSLEDVHALRLVNRDVSDEMQQILFKNLVAPFGSSFKDMCTGLPNSMLATNGPLIAKFGISFEYDGAALAFASPKKSLKTEQAWYGSYQWPEQQYHRYEELKSLESIVDNNTHLLDDVFAHLSGTYELGLSIDSGHGWLEGPDISDMALYKRRQMKGSRVFGQVFENEHVWQKYSRDEYFKWAQQNSINILLTALAARSGTADVLHIIDTIPKFEIRERDSFKNVQSQPDCDPYSHTGGRATNPNTAGAAAGAGGPPPALPPAAAMFGFPVNQPVAVAPHQVQAGGMNAIFAQNMAAGVGLPAYQALQALRPPPAPMLYGATLQGSPSRTPRGQRANPTKKAKAAAKKRSRVPLQWPLIFNGHNLAAETGGCLSSVQAKAANVKSHPLLPGSLNEAQVQWLMETLWAQRSFLSAYTGAIISNAPKLRHVHTLTISRLSSGLLPSLAQPKFWESLPNLRRLTLLVLPDWRKEHREQDVYIQKESIISPLGAVAKFADFLRQFICRQEKLYRATFGWASGGENAVGICARNQHLLPAPIIQNVLGWISDHDKATKADPEEMLKFDHLCDLTFENCWFSPYMLETFMGKSRQTSLRTLTLKSVSMLARHHTTSTQHQFLVTQEDGLACKHEEEAWLQETLPDSAAWTEVLDAITPGKCLEDRKYDAGMIDIEQFPKPKRAHRGRLECIVLESCGYAYLENMTTEKFNQRNIVAQQFGCTDQGLKSRESALRGHFYLVAEGKRLSKVTSMYGVAGAEVNKNDLSVDIGPIMLESKKSSDRWRGLGTLSQCVHPIERRVLEQAWGMRFGWGDNLDRWAAVEDGQLEGGTGRFSGVLRDDMDADLA